MTIVDDPKAVRSVLIGAEWIHVQNQSFQLFDVDGVTWFRFQEGRTGYAGHRLDIGTAHLGHSGPLAGMTTYTLAEVIASGCAVELEDVGDPCDRCDAPEGVVLTQWALLCHPCQEDAWRRDVGYARLAERRYREWVEAVREAFAEGLFDELTVELDEALEDVAGWSAERMMRDRR